MEWILMTKNNLIIFQIPPRIPPQFLCLHWNVRQKDWLIFWINELVFHYFTNDLLWMNGLDLFTRWMFPLVYEWCRGMKLFIIFTQITDNIFIELKVLLIRKHYNTTSRRKLRSTMQWSSRNILLDNTSALMSLLYDLNVYLCIFNL